MSRAICNACEVSSGIQNKEIVCKECNKTISNVLNYIKNMTGLSLVLCNYFVGIRTNTNGYYINIVLEKPIHESKEVLKLESLVNNSNVITKVSPNGDNRLAIFFNESELLK